MKGNGLNTGEFSLKPSSSWMSDWRKTRRRGRGKAAVTPSTSPSASPAFMGAGDRLRGGPATYRRPLMGKKRMR